MKAQTQPTEFDSDYAQRATSINPEDIQTEYVNTTSDLYHWNARHIEATGIRTAAESNLANIEAQSLIVLKYAKENGADVVIGGMTFKGGKSITEEFIHAAFKLDPTWKAAFDVLASTQEMEAKTKAVVGNIKLKAEMLISLGTHLRQERDLHLNNEKRTR